MPEYRNITGEIKLLQRENDFIYPVEIWLLNDKVNRNNWKFVNLEEHKDKWTGIPILVAYVGEKVGDGHNFSVRTDKKGKKYQSFTGATAERICGSMSEKISDIRIEERDGATWTVGKGSLWAWYNHELCAQVSEWAEQGRTMSVSIEALIEEFHKDENGVEVETKFLPLGVTLLGEGVAPAVDGAHIRKLQEIAGEFEELKLRAASYIESEGEEIETPAKESKIKPQKNINDKERSTLKAFSKKQLASLSARFDGYTAIAAGQDDNGIHVCLMSADGGTAVYTMENLDETIAPEKITKNNAQVVFEFGEDAIQVDCCTITDELSATIVRANSQIESLTAEITTANEALDNMREMERKRRLQAAKSAALATLEAFNANRDDKISDAILKSLNDAIDNGDFSECEDKDGCWTGEAEVKNKVLAMCAEKQMEIDKANSDRRHGISAWEAFGGDNNYAETGVAALINEYGK